jgi:hypothetical protein
LQDSRNSLTASGSATVESAQWIGEQGLKVIYRDADGGLGERFVYRDDELPPPVEDMPRQPRPMEREPEEVVGRPTLPTFPPLRRTPERKKVSLVGMQGQSVVLQTLVFAIG